MTAQETQNSSDYGEPRREPDGYHRFRNRLSALGFLAANSVFLFRELSVLTEGQVWTSAALGAMAAALVVYPSSAIRTFWAILIVLAMKWLPAWWMLLIVIGTAPLPKMKLQRRLEQILQTAAAGYTLFLIFHHEWMQSYWWMTAVVLLLPYRLLYHWFLRRFEPK